ncbi:hypothetical protein [Xylocopilactobacillus apicola]|uniref:Uncharacterized protein n=1 Tax=Xylocopilactobacillus apicola TaxID=2932184 RepID=A0AAU9DN73_9LACO|nr:hypothetical protein [Xylocopilactobacillus apicola]BDR58497.1 hypothetical protein XA3_09380 [Xylocopilactobacillus apicola]
MFPYQFEPGKTYYYVNNLNLTFEVKVIKSNSQTVTFKTKFNPEWTLTPDSKEIKEHRIFSSKNSATVFANGCCS